MQQTFTLPHMQATEDFDLISSYFYISSEPKGICLCNKVLAFNGKLRRNKEARNIITQPTFEGMRRQDLQEHPSCLMQQPPVLTKWKLHSKNMK